MSEVHGYFIRKGGSTIEVPFQTLGNKTILTSLEVLREPAVAAFVKRFEHCFERAETGDYYVFYPEGIPLQ